jgi:hypothetical protein
MASFIETMPAWQGGLHRIADTRVAEKPGNPMLTGQS